MNAYSRPVILKGGMPARQLERVQLSESVDGALSEKSFQEALFANPEALPISDIDGSFGSLIPLCMELSTDSGRIDILYASSTGRLVLVETKLWRNPQARREVVAQILDYAAQLTHWSFEDLDARVSLSRKESPGFLIRAVKNALPGTDESHYIDTLSASMRRGEFLLLIAGDGIRQGAESLVTLLERSGHLRFKLALVEMAAYRLSPEQILLQPRVLACTEVIERQLLLLNGEPVELAESASSDDLPVSADLEAQRARYVQFWSAFLEELVRIDASYRGVNPAKSTNQYFAMPPGMKSSWVSAYVSKSRGVAGVFFTMSKNFAESGQVFDALSGQLAELSEEIGCELAIESAGASDGNRKMLFCENLAFDESMLETPTPGWLRTLAERTARMIQALTPRLNAVLQGE